MNIFSVCLKSHS